MKTAESLKARYRKVTSGPSEQLGRIERLLRTQILVWRFCALRLRDTNAMAMSAALSFRTIFALVPILILAFLLVKSFGVIESSKGALRQLLEQSGMTQIAYPQSTAPAPEGPPPDDAPPELTVADAVSTGSQE